ncbi:WW domain-binding protein 1 isoform X1 [Callorhinchus milii]|uniref:WW domain-binding protein 1-like n=1 Tax=Callorhinchus milii TaxID=7868 RepID=A0A4W3H4L6_CALMI|nr:WW domain-binding protein 1 isoform X1 [Callorhinchus milii]|eukprot:gi/632985615/ref/XP_007909782.1/ PREDICTED: WW domain-binding protein 1-like isoform X1 [Callorhinchus milii]
MARRMLGFFLFISPAFPVGPSRMDFHAEAKELCFGVNEQPYWCETGYCCGETECCTYYYELWWFWLVWTIILMLSCCCAYRHRRVKLRLQQEQRQREISLMAYQGASTYTTQPLDLRFWTNCKLPAYEEVAGHPPTPPPPYSELQQQQQQQQNTVQNNSRDTAVGGSHEQLSSREAVASLPGQVEAEPRPQTESNSFSSDEHEAESGQEPATCTPAPANCSGDEHDTVSTQGEESDLHPASDLHSLDLDPHICDHGETKEESSSRHRRITGDSGIEVCVCRMDEDPYPEEVGLMGSVAAQPCCEPQSSYNSSPQDTERGSKPTLNKQSEQYCPGEQPEDV